LRSHVNRIGHRSAVTRTYRLGRRAEQRAETRARIVTAARDLYAERGYAGTSMLAVAAIADVAPNTVRNHFPTPAELATAVGTKVLEDLDLPEPPIFDGMPTLAARLKRLSSELASLSRRGDAWWALMQREPELGAAWAPLEAAYEQRLQALIRAALGPLADDEVAVAVVATTIGPTTFYGLQQRGLPADDARRIGVELVVPWLERRGLDRTTRPGDGSP
jgi:AcrR family transcriptional regulator